MNSGTGLQSRRTSICESQILPVNTTIQKAIREEPGTLHYHCTSRLPFFYAQTANDGARGVEEESEGGTGSRSGRRHPVSFTLTHFRFLFC